MTRQISRTMCEIMGALLFPPTLVRRPAFCVLGLSSQPRPRRILGGSGSRLVMELVTTAHRLLLWYNPLCLLALRAHPLVIEQDRVPSTRWSIIQGEREGRTTRRYIKPRQKADARFLSSKDIREVVTGAKTKRFSAQCPEYPPPGAASRKGCRSNYSSCYIVAVAYRHNPISISHSHAHRYQDPSLPVTPPQRLPPP